VALGGILPAVAGLLAGRFRIARGRLVTAPIPVWVAAPTLVLLGVFALRAAVIFSTQA
jgi:hypothetical protein